MRDVFYTKPLYLRYLYGPQKKSAQQRAREQNSDLRVYYLHTLSDFQLYHLVFVDEWAPLGKTPLQLAQFHRDKAKSYLR